MPTSNRSSARRRALRAAHAVTLGLGLAAATSGCSSSHGPGPGDASVPTDATADAADAAPDGAVDCSSPEWWNMEACCEPSGGFWDGTGCLVPGPFVPPDVPV